MAEFEQPNNTGDFEKILQIVFCHIRSISLIIFIVLAVTAFFVYRMPFEYRAKTTIFPSTMLRSHEGGIQSSIMSGVTRQLGINFGGGAPDQSILYESILQSRQFLIRVINRSFENENGKTVVLRDYLDPEGTGDAVGIQNAFEIFLVNSLRVKYKPETGMTSISVILQDPAMVAAVANGIVEEIEKYTHEMLSSGSSDWAGFIEERLEEVGASLEASEIALESFREKNRVTNHSPVLLLQLGRLKREVELQQQLFITLKQQYEMARIEAQKDIAKISVLDEAVVPIRRFRPRRSLYMAFALFFGFFIGLAQALVRNRYPNFYLRVRR